MIDMSSAVVPSSYLEIRCPERGRKRCETLLCASLTSLYLEIRCPERGRKPNVTRRTYCHCQFGNKMPREGTETMADRQL